MGIRTNGASATSSESNRRERRFSAAGAATGFLIGTLPLVIAYVGGSGFMYVAAFLPMFAVIFAPLLALFCGALPMWWPARSDPILALMKFLAVCLALSLYGGGADGLAIAMMFVLPIFLVGLFGIVAHMALRPWDGGG